MVKSISLWEKTKRVVAHSFGLETKSEIAEHFERLAEEERQRQLRLAHAQHVRALEIEYAEQIEAFQKERQKLLKQLEEEAEERRREEERRKEMEERVRLYRDNRKRQGASIYADQPSSTVAEDTTNTQN